MLVRLLMTKWLIMTLTSTLYVGSVFAHETMAVKTDDKKAAISPTSKCESQDCTESAASSKLTPNGEVSIEAERDKENKKPELIESIGVVGRYPLAYFKRNMLRAEDDFFNMMNSLIDDNDFKVTCKSRNAQAFSRLVKRACEANFVSRLIGEQMQRHFDHMSLSAKNADAFDIPTTLSTQKLLDKKNKEYLALMVEKINSEPELLKAYQALELAKHQYNLVKNSQD